jgi:sugar-specific transcriptional regulator TrmB
MEREELRKTLKETGFTEGESKAYLAMLELGESKVGPIIKKSGISRSKMYDILERLIKKGVVSKIEKRGVLIFQALPPHAILNLIRIKEDELKKEENLLLNIIPELSKIKAEQKVNVVVYEGFNGFKAMIDRLIDEIDPKDTFDAMGISQTTEGMRHYARKIYDVQKKKKFKARSIFDEKGSFKIKERETPWHEMRVLPKGWSTPALITIYNETVGIHLGKEGVVISIVIKSKEIEKSFRATFGAMWKIAKK